MSFVIGTADLAAHFHVTALRFFKQNKLFGNLTPDKQFTFIQAHQLVVALVDDILNSRLQWAASTEQFEDLLDVMFPSLSLKRKTLLASKFTHDVIHDIEARISSQVYHDIPADTWDIWSVKKLGHDLFLIKGQDYRVYDWERRMASGEWKDEKTS
jgi:hypothetical protein